MSDNIGYIISDVMSNISSILLWGLLGYLLGCILFGPIWARIFSLGDLRQTGSGNVGTTNVLRSAKKGKKHLAIAAALLTLLCDMAKGFVAVILAAYFVDNYDTSYTTTPALILAAGLGAVLGHNFPLHAGLKGGKGVATSLGVLLALSLPVGMIALGTWALVALITGYSSLAALVTLNLAPAVGWLMLPSSAGTWSMSWLSAWVFTTGAIGVLALVRHRANISRLIKGTESKIK